MNEIINKYIVFNPSVSELYDEATTTDGLNVSSTGALLAYSGEKTGRSPKDKRIVLDENTKDIWWGNVNMPISPELFGIYRNHAVEHLNDSNRLYQIDVLACWDEKNQVKVRVYCQSSYHALFMLNLLIPVDKPFDKPDFTIYNVGELKLGDCTRTIVNHDLIDNKLTDTLVGLNLTSNEMVIYGTRYAGEMKKGILTLIMYLMPIKGNLPLHSSANIKDDNLSLFFGLSGTGKTTLSSDSSRSLIGDDEHVWTVNGVFNVEGGCYAKCINLKEKSEPEIFRAIRYGAVLENVVHDENYIVNYDNTKITENTRCAYPLHFIPNALIPAKVSIQPTNIILLTCDIFGVLPPVAKLSYEQAVYFFISGYTSKVAGTEVGVKVPQSTFSACFGEPFLVWSPTKYGELLKEKLQQNKPSVWLLNTGWIKGPYGIGHRISIEDTRTILNAIHDGSLTKEEFVDYPYFNFKVPLNCPSIIDKNILDPRNNFSNKDEYNNQLKNLYDQFTENYNRKHK